MNEEQMITTLAYWFDIHANQCFWNNHLFPWESDLLVVSKSGYVTEVEVKISREDWMADRHKAKWRPCTPKWAKGEDIHHTKGWKYIKRFFYAVPSDVLEKGVPEFVDSTTGIIEVKTFDRSWGQKRLPLIARPAVNRKAEKLTPQLMTRLYQSMYHRAWDARKRVYS